MRTLALLLALALPSWIHLPAEVERWLYNPRQQTQVARERLAAGESEAATRALDRAARLAPEDPRTLYNAGSLRLAREVEGAAELVQQAITRLQPGDPLLADAFYNLGNARLSGGNAAAARDAYEQALRAAPRHLRAKHNLEIALRRLRQQQGMRRGERESPSGEAGGDEEPSRQNRGGGTGRPQRRQPRTGEETAQEPDTSQDERGGERQAPQHQKRRPELPGFQKQPDMTAAQASAILDAIRKRELGLRRTRALKRAQQSSGEVKDW